MPFLRPTLVILSALLFAGGSAFGGNLHLEPCENPSLEGARCGTLSVAENPQAAKARHIDLRVVVLEATGSEPAPDPIFYLAGGPGTAATDMARFFASSPLREHRAVVLVDQRGTGGSNPLHCPVGPFAESLEMLLSFDLSSVAASCAEDLSKKADLRFYGTRQVADDLDAVRRALGYEKVNLIGGSYGTRVALEYLRRHGKHARTALLRGVAGPEVSVPLGFSRSSLDALRGASERCKASEACASDLPDLEAEVRRLKARLDAQPAKVELQDPATGKAVTMEVDGSELVAMLHYAFYGQQFAAVVPTAVKAARDGDLEPILKFISTLASQLLPRFHFGSFLSVMCGEDAPYYDLEDVDRASRDTLLGGTLSRGILTSCQHWPTQKVPADFKQPVKSDVPVLLISGRVDPVTPPRDAESASSHLSRSRHVILPDIAHFSFFPGCAEDLAQAFLDSGDVAGLGACGE